MGHHHHHLGADRVISAEMPQPTADMNVTPMIDVLLVLLIIFMMVIPMSRKAIDLQLPDPTPDDTNQ